MSNLKNKQLSLFVIITIGIYLACNLLANNYFNFFKIISGLTVLFFIPGAVIAILLEKKALVKASILLLKSLAINIAFLICVTTVTKLSGFSVTQNNLIIEIIAASLVFLSILKNKKVTVENDFKKTSPAIYIAVILLLGFLFIYFGEDLKKSENDFLPDTTFEKFTREDFKALDYLSADYGGGLSRLAEKRFKLEDKEAEVKYYNHSLHSVKVNIRYLIQNFADTKAVFIIKKDNEIILRQDIPSRFIIGKNARNYEANSFLVSKAIVLSPGASKIRLSIDNYPFSTEGEGAGLVINDLTNLGRKQALKFVQKYYSIGDTGDRQEIIEAAENFKDHLFTFTYSFDGDRFDKGGYTVSTMPLDSYLVMLNSLILGGGLQGLNYFRIGCLVLMFIFIVNISCQSCKNSQDISLSVILCLLTMLIYSFLDGFGREAVDDQFTLPALFFLGGIYFFLEKENKYFLLFCAFLLLMKPGILLVFAAFFACLIICKETKLVIKNILVVAVIFVLCLGSILWVGYRHHLLDVWKDILIWEYGDRLNLVWQCFGGGWGHMVYLCKRLFRFTSLVLLGSYLLPLVFLFKKDKTSMVYLTGIGIYYFLLGISYTQRMVYIIPIILIMPVIAIRILSAMEKVRIRRLIFFSLIITGLITAGFWSYLGADYTNSSRFGGYTILVYARVHPEKAGRYFFRNAEENLEQGKLNEARLNYLRASDIAPDLRIPAYLKIGMIYEKKGDYPSAKKEWRKALRLDPLNSEVKKLLEEKR